MPSYLHRCDCGQEFTHFRPMAQSGDLVTCACGKQAKRVYTSNPIMIRPDGWNLRPGEPGYSNLGDGKQPRTNALSHQS